MTKWVYKFGDGKAEGHASDRNLLGGKGANLAEMSSIGIPVPPGFTVTTEVCTYFYENGKTFPADLKEQVKDGVAHCEAIVGRKFADPENPLLFSVRSGARVSMPGMMDTVLNLGLNDETVKGLAKASGNERFAYDSYRRFIQMYSNVVLNMDHHDFEHALENMKNAKGYKSDVELTVDDLKALIEEYKKIGAAAGKPVPQDPEQQLWGGIGAVFNSWMVDRAIYYRKLNNIPESWGTAVNVQTMVFGNSGDNSATGVCFSRDPSTGRNVFYGEYLKNAQGEDVVAGIRTPQQMSKEGKKERGSDLPCLEEEMPELYKQLCDIRETLEKHYRDMQDMEFTIQDGKLYMLQTRNGKRTGAAALKIAVDMVNEGLIDKKTAITRVEPQQLDALLHPTLDPKAKKAAKVLTSALPASPGAAVGKVVFSADDAEKWAEEGEKVVLVRIETSPEDIHGMHVSQGILTARGGMTSHAAVVARGMGTPAVCGAGDVKIDYAAKQFKVGDTVVKEGDVITLDGSTGEVILGAVATKEPELVGDFGLLMGWADEIRTLKVRTNADTPHDAEVARKFGAEGIGLCRTEHMFFDPNRIAHMREMIIASNEADRRAALAKLLPYQRDDFKGLFIAMDGLHVTIRLLDPPLHEFLPQKENEQREIAKELGVDVDVIKTRVAQLHEANPMLGHRGCRLGVTYPEIYEMQAQAIFEAAVEASKELGKQVEPEVMIPLVGTKKELDLMKAAVDKMAEEVMTKAGKKFNYTVGTMIELPRAALTADKIAETAEFFSFGTNDLTQTTLGMSRDDAGAFLPEYVRKGIYARDPFASIDEEGVGEMVRIAVEKGRKTRPNIKLGICGEHGGDPATIDFCHRVGLTYVSCSPYRVPIARLAAAQAAVKNA
ncbi:phosphoenolpyruvate synthase/pyruvate phosphate dikinase [Acetobacter sp. CAG:977]|nr:phosphoenolpyruvate synthase/pyruvate phosphate dikinase [Acetobacter sp. CAG:977]